MQFTPDRPQASVRGPNGETLNVTAMALPPGQSAPAGWVKQPDGSIQPPNVAAVSGQQSQQLPRFQPNQGQPQQGPMQQTWPAQAGHTATAPAPYQPASASYVPASERQQSRIQHGAFNPPPPATPYPPQQPAVTPPPPSNVPASLPALPTTAQPTARSSNLPPVGSVPGNVPAMPITPGGFAGPVGPVNLPPGGGAAAPPTSAPPVNFDPNSPVGAWATPGAPPVAPVPPPPPGAGFTPTVEPPPPPGAYDSPNVPVIIKRPA